MLRKILIALPVLIAGCATTDSQTPTATEAPVSREKQVQAQRALASPSKPRLKRKIAIGRVTNETRYGRSLLRDSDLDPLGKQAADILVNRLVETGRFLVFERPDIKKIENEQAFVKESNFVGVDALILGSLTEFGRSTTGKSGFMSSTKKQLARATIELRIVDVRTGHVFFSASGTGEAAMESGRIAGFGSKASYDATLNDRAISAAIANVQNDIINKLESRPWRADILKISGGNIYISGGKHQGLKPGDLLAIMQAGEKIKSKQTGFNISLPATELATAKIISLFGDSETNEGSIAKLVNKPNSLKNIKPNILFVIEKKAGTP